MSVTNPCTRGAHPNCQAPDSCDCSCHRRVGVTRGPKHRPEIELKWEDPPAANRTTKPIAERIRPLILELKRNPKRWGRLALYHSKTGAQGSRKKCNDEFPDCEFTVRIVDDGKSALFGRFMGE